MISAINRKFIKYHIQSKPGWKQTFLEPTKWHNQFSPQLKCCLHFKNLFSLWDYLKTNWRNQKQFPILIMRHLFQFSRNVSVTEKLWVVLVLNYQLKLLICLVKLVTTLFLLKNKKVFLFSFFFFFQLLISYFLIFNLHFFTNQTWFRTSTGTRRQKKAKSHRN